MSGAEARAAAVVRADIQSLKGYHVVPFTGPVKIDLMENPYRLPAELQAKVAAAVAEVALNRYPVPTHDHLCAQLRSVMAVPDDLALIIGNGSDDLLALLTVIVAKPGATVLAIEPSFPMYRMNAVFTNMQYVGVPLNADFTLDVDRVLAAIDLHQPALVWIAYPNNPTGNLYPVEAIEAIIARTPGVVAIDEAYFPFSAGATFLNRLTRYDNVVLIRTLSKLGLAGARLGFAVAPAAWIAPLEKVRQPFNVNVLTEAAVSVVLDHYSVLESQTAALVKSRARLEALLDQIAIPRGAIRFPSAANFVTVRVANAPATYEALKARGILIRNFHGAHPLLAHCLRITVGTDAEIDRLAQALPDCLVDESCAAPLSR
jgi:histidinol-phosphate aminotransferase